MVCNQNGYRCFPYSFACLNPYSTGIWSATQVKMSSRLVDGGLNPYSTGIWSATAKKAAIEAKEAAS